MSGGARGGGARGPFIHRSAKNGEKLAVATVYGWPCGRMRAGADDHAGAGAIRPARRPPGKVDTRPATRGVVFGDSMADWLAHGFEDALGDAPDIAVIRKNRATAGLIRYDTRNENQDWPQVIRETFAQSKPNFVVM